MLKAHNTGMSDTTPNTTITIESEQDYRAAQAARRDAVADVERRAKAEGWTVEQTIAAKVEAILPYYRALFDPANSVSEAVVRSDKLSLYGNRAMLLSREDYPELFAERDSQTAQLNTENNVNYNPPPIYAVSRLVDDDGSQLAYHNGAVWVDADFLQSKVPVYAMAALIGHELSHRYERSDEYLTAQITLELEDSAGIPNSENALRIIRAAEARADLTSARLTTPIAMREGLDYATAESTRFKVSVIHFQQTRGIVDDAEAANLFNNLPKDKQNRFYESYSRLPKEQRTAINTQVAEDSNYLETYSEHPSTPHRLEMLRLLEAQPEIMACKIVQFDGSANIIEATNCGPRNVPLIVDGVPTGNRVRQ